MRAIEKPTEITRADAIELIKERYEDLQEDSKTKMLLDILECGLKKKTLMEMTSSELEEQLDDEFYQYSVID